MSDPKEADEIRKKHEKEVKQFKKDLQQARQDFDKEMAEKEKERSKSEKTVARKTGKGDGVSRKEKLAIKEDKSVKNTRWIVVSRRKEEGVNEWKDELEVREDGVDHRSQSDRS